MLLGGRQWRTLVHTKSCLLNCRPVFGSVSLPIIRSSCWPAGPTKGEPTLTSSAPRASPSNITPCVNFPDGAIKPCPFPYRVQALQAEGFGNGPLDELG